MGQLFSKDTYPKFLFASKQNVKNIAIFVGAFFLGKNHRCLDCNARSNVKRCTYFEIVLFSIVSVVDEFDLKMNLGHFEL